MPVILPIEVLPTEIVEGEVENADDKFIILDGKPVFDPKEQLRLLFMMFHPECFVCGTPVQFLFSNERRILNGRL